MNNSEHAIRRLKLAWPYTKSLTNVIAHIATLGIMIQHRLLFIKRNNDSIYCLTPLILA